MLERLLADSELAGAPRAPGRERAAGFGWGRAAPRTWPLLDRVARR